MKDKDKIPAKTTGLIHPKNCLNELTGGEWLYQTKTVLHTNYPSILGHNLRKKHGANKPPQLMAELISFFTKTGELVLDPFAGVGGTLLGAWLCDRKAVGIEINQQWIDIYKEVCQLENVQQFPIIQGNNLDILPTLEANSFDFIATDPPYMPNVPKTMSTNREGYQNRKTDYDKFSDYKEDFANMTYEQFMDKMAEVMKECLRVLKAGKYMCMIIRNQYKDGRYIMTHADMANIADTITRVEKGQKQKFVLKGEKIWYQAGSRLRPYGYPFSFVPNLIHQNILIWRKETENVQARTGARG